MIVALVIIVVTLSFAVAIYAFAYNRGLRNQRKIPFEKTVSHTVGEVPWILRGISGERSGPEQRRIGKRVDPPNQTPDV